MIFTYQSKPPKKLILSSIGEGRERVENRDLHKFLVKVEVGTHLFGGQFGSI